MNSPNKIFLLTEDNTTYQQLLDDRALENAIITHSPDDANILLAAPPMIADRLDEFSQMQWLQSTYAGVNALMSPDLRQDYTLTNVRGIFGPLISEYVLGYCLDHYRHLQHYREQQTRKEWRPHPYQSLQGKVVAILGTGSIGNALAATCRAFGCHVIGINRTGIPPAQSQFDTTFHINELDQALSRAHIVVNTLPSTPDTHHILNQQCLQHARDILLFNVGRGDAIHNADLLLAIKNRWVAHAFLDVFEQEPLAAEHPLWRLPQVTITPHIAAVSFPEQVVAIFANNYEKWHQGYQLDHQVDFNRGY